MSLQQAGKWNNIPKELMPELPEAGSTVVFNIKDVQFTDIEGKPRFRQWCTLPSTSSFLNPKTKEIIPIALIRSTNERGEVDSFKKLDFQPFKTAGTYQITIGASEDDNDTYRFLKKSLRNHQNCRGCKRHFRNFRFRRRRSICFYSKRIETSRYPIARIF